MSSSFDQIIQTIIQVFQEFEQKKTVPMDTQAEVVRIEGDTAWVHIPGGVDETPVKLTINASAGDIVQLRLNGGKAWITGNVSAPPTDDQTAIHARTIAREARTAATQAQETAGEAQVAAEDAQGSADTAAQAASDAQGSAATAKAAADNAGEYAARALGNLSTVQSVAETLTYITQHGTMTLTADTTLDPTHVYFVRDAGGDYTVGGVNYAIVTEPDVADIATYYELTIDESLQNYVGTHLALTGEGLWLLPASTGTNKVLIATGAGSTYTTAGTYLVDSGGNTVASFRQDGATMSSGGNLIAHLGYGSGVDEQGGTSDAPYYSLGKRIGTVGNRSVAEGYNATASGYCSHAEGYGATASNNASHAEGYGTIASGRYAHAEGWGPTASGDGSHAEGERTTASGVGSHAEGHETTASRPSSHAEGWGTTASGSGSHAEGYETTASGPSSHAEGTGTTASGDSSHAGGYYTKASSSNQTVLGKWNAEDTANTYACIIGNGTSDSARSNALVIDWNGNVIAQGFAGKVEMFAGAVTQTVTNGVATTTGAPAGWLLCDGSVLNKSDYPELAAVLGSLYGGNGTTTFALPDMRGRFPLGVGNGTASGHTNHALASGGGAETVKLTAAQSGVPAHQHGASGLTVSPSGHKIKTNSYALGSGGTSRNIITSAGSLSSGTVTDGHSISGSVANNTANDATSAHNNMPPYIGINFIIATGRTS